MTKLYYLILGKAEEEKVERRRSRNLISLSRGLDKKSILKERKCNLLREQRTIAKQANLSMMLYT